MIHQMAIMIEFHTLLPHISLRPYIKMYFWGRDANPPDVQRIVPNGEMGLWFYRGNKVKYVGRGEVQSCLSGQPVTFLDISSRGEIEIVGAHFTVLGACLFFRNLNGAFGEFINVNDSDDRELKELEERVALAKCYADCWTEMETFFLRRLTTTDVDILNLKRLHRAISYGQRHLAEVRIDDIATEACLSRRHFGRLFSELVGLSPKDFLRLRRYHKTLSDIKTNRTGISLTEIAWRNGYYDFSHLSSDFRKITGYSPSHLLHVSENDNDEIGWRI